MQGLGPDGKPTGQKATFTGASKANATARRGREAPDEADRRRSRRCSTARRAEEIAKLMKIQVLFGNTFGAEKLVRPSAAPPTATSIPAPPYLGSMIRMLDQCAKGRAQVLCALHGEPAPLRLLQRPEQPAEMQIVYEGYPLQKDLDWVHARLGAPDLNKRSCACYCEGSGQRPQARNHGGLGGILGGELWQLRARHPDQPQRRRIDLICAMTGKAPFFGLMTDEGRQAKWLIDVKTSKDAGLGVLGPAVGRKVVEDVPLYTGIAQHSRGARSPRTTCTS